MLKRFIIILLLLSFTVISFADEIYYSKPPLGTLINWAAPNTEGLIGCWLFNEGGGRRATELVHNLAFNNQLLKYRYGNAYFDGATTYLNLPAKYLIETYTICITFKTATDARMQLLDTYPANGSIAYPYEFTTDWTTPNRKANLRFYGPIDVDLFSTTVINNNAIHQFIGVRKKPSYLRLYLDSRLEASGIDGNYNSLSNGTGTPWFGRRFDGSEDFTGEMYYAFFWTKQFTHQQAQSLYIAPYKIIKNNYRNFMYAGVFGGAAPPAVTARSQMWVN